MFSAFKILAIAALQQPTSNWIIFQNLSRWAKKETQLCFLQNGCSSAEVFVNFSFTAKSLVNFWCFVNFLFTGKSQAVITN